MPVERRGLRRTQVGRPARGRQSKVRGKRRGGQSEWSVLSSRGAVFFYVALNPGSTRAEIASALGMTDRAVWSLLRDLRRAGALRPQRNGRRYHYVANLDVQFRHPALSDYTVRSLLIAIAKRSGR